MKAIDPKDYLEQFEPELKKKLEAHVLRGEVCRVMAEYLKITITVNNEERHEFLKSHLTNKK